MAFLHFQDEAVTDMVKMLDERITNGLGIEVGAYIELMLKRIA